MANLNFQKLGGLIPAIIQDAQTKNVLMLGFMNREAYDKTVAEGKVTFFSRTKIVYGQRVRKVVTFLTWCQSRMTATMTPC